MNIQNYLDRIQYTGGITPTLEVLKKLQHQHLLSIPFENLDIHFGAKISLDLDKFYRKIVEFKRGGFCYELNGLFNQLLTAMGFEVRIIYSQVYNKEGKFYHPKFGHLANIVTIENQEYLVDVGFGDFITEPVPIILNEELEDLSGTYKITTFDQEHLLISKMTNSDFTPNYVFSTKSQELHKFNEQCHFQQTSPTSQFTQKKVCSILTESGRVSLSDKALKITKNGTIHERSVASQSEFLELLESYFNISLNQLNYL